MPSRQTCCGQVFVNSGYPEQGRGLMGTTLAAFADCDAVVAPSGSCVATVRHQYAALTADADRTGGRAPLAGTAVDGADVAALAARTYELTEYLVDVLKVVDVGARYPARVAYHPTCHSLRSLRVGERPRLLLEQVRDLDLVELPDATSCCGFGGTFAVKNAATSAAMLADKVGAATASGASVLCASDASCLMHIGGGLARRLDAPRPVHLAEILAAT